MKKIFSGNSLQFLNRDMSAGEKSLKSQYNQYLSSADLDEEAGNLSSYNGGMDDFLNYDGNIGSFMDPMQSGKLYTIILTNANANTRYALLCPGLLRNAVGLMQDGAFNDTGSNAGLSGTGTPQAIAYLNAFVDKFPTIVSAFKVSTSNVTQFEMPITIQKQSPFKNYDSRNISIAAWASEANPNTTLISVQDSFYMDCKTSIQYPVLGSTQVSLQLFFGVSLDIAMALRNKAKRASATMAMANNPAAVSSYRGRR